MLRGAGSYVFRTIKWATQALTLGVRRRLRRRPKRWVHLKLDGRCVHFAAQRPRRPWWLSMALPVRSAPWILRDVIALSKQVVQDPKVLGLSIECHDVDIDWADVGILIDALAGVRDAKKGLRIHFARSPSSELMQLSAVASELSAAPSTTIAPFLRASSPHFFVDALRRVGIQVHVAHAGRYKSAPERFTLRARSAPDREQSLCWSDGVRAFFQHNWLQYRSAPFDAIATLSARAPLAAEAAQEGGWLDTVGFENEADHHPPPKQRRDTQYARAYRRLSHPPRPRWGARQVALIPVVGNIVDDVGGARGLPGRKAYDRRVEQHAFRALRDRRVGAALILIDSRGGSVSAAERMYEALRILAKEKPTVACITNAGASGGYLVACASPTIVAHPLSLTGSIGVFSLIPDLSDLRRRCLIHTDSTSLAEAGQVLRPFDRVSDRQRQDQEARVQAIYDRFLALVASARSMAPDQVAQVAQGRVWSGRDAHAHGLVDALGGPELALVHLQRTAGTRLAPEPIVGRAGPGKADFSRQLLSLRGDALMDKIAAGADRIRYLRETAWAHTPPTP